VGRARDGERAEGRAFVERERERSEFRTTKFRVETREIYHAGSTMRASVTMPTSHPAADVGIR